MKMGTIILSGGKSSRFGTDKGLFEFRGRPLVQYSLMLAQKFSSQTVISTQNTDYKQFDCDLIGDIFPDTGPLGGIHAGLINSSFDVNLVLPCDTPFLSDQIIELLISNYTNEDVVIFQTSDNKYHPLTGLYHKRIIPFLEMNLRQGKFKLIDIILQLNIKIIELNAHNNLEICFANLNSKDDFQSINNLMS